ncbi:MAG: tetratricopeptide repeat protein [Desulfobacteraceae bacterium]|jgi:hypothetical protein
MSLLNDALRKNRVETQPVTAVSGRLSPRPIHKKKIINYKMLLLAISSVLFVGGLLFWYFHTTTQSKESPVNALVTTDQVPTTPPTSAFTVPTVTAVESAPHPAADAMPQPTTKQTDVKALEQQQSTNAPAEQVVKSISNPIPPSPTPDANIVPKKITTESPPPKIQIKKEVNKKTVKSSPFVAHLFEKAQHYHQQKRLGDAINMYHMVLKTDAQHYDTRFNLVSAYLQTGAYDKAYPMAMALHRLHPNDPAIVLNLAVACIGRGDALKGLELLDQVDKNSTIPLFKIYLHQGVANRQLGRLETAIVCYHKAEQINPGNPHLLFNLAIAYDQLQQYDNAIRYYRKYIRLAAKDSPSTQRQVEQRIHTLLLNISDSTIVKDKP